MTNFITINGIKIFYYYEDKKYLKQKTVVLFHGLRSNFRAFKDLINMERDFRIIALDLISHGLSENKENTTLEMMAENADEFLKKMNIKDGEYIALGHSLGGGVISNLKLRPNKVILLAPFNPYLHKYSSKDNLEKLIDPKNIEEALYSVRSLISPSSNRAEYFNSIDQMAKILLSEVKKKQPFLNTLIHEEILSDKFLEHGITFYSKIRDLPTQIVWGEDDKFVPRGSVEDLAALINSSLIILPHTGHAPIYERCEKMKKLITAFI